MKKFFFIVAAAAGLLFAAQTASAQLYFGGSLGLTSSTQHTPAAISATGADETVSGSSICFLPEVGYKINGRMAVGGRIGYGTGPAAFGDMDPNDAGFANVLNGINNDLNNTTNITTSFTFAPYFRYYIYDGRRFSFFAEGIVCFGAMNTKAKDNAGVWQDGAKWNMFEIGAKPGFSINFDNHFAIIGHLGFVGFQSLKNARNDVSMSRLGLSMSTNSLTIGFVYSL